MKNAMKNRRRCGRIQPAFRGEPGQWRNARGQQVATMPRDFDRDPRKQVQGCSHPRCLKDSESEGFLYQPAALALDMMFLWTGYRQSYEPEVMMLLPDRGECAAGPVDMYRGGLLGDTSVCSRAPRVRTWRGADI